MTNSVELLTSTSSLNSAFSFLQARAILPALAEEHNRQRRNERRLLNVMVKGRNHFKATISLFHMKPGKC